MTALHLIVNMSGNNLHGDTMKDHNLHVEVEVMIGLEHTLHIVTMRNLGLHTVQTTADMLALNDTTTTIVIVMLITTKLISGLITAEVMLVQIVITIGQSIKNLMSLMFASFAINVATLRNTVTLMPNLQNLGQNFPKVTTTGLETGTIVDHETVLQPKKTD